MPWRPPTANVPSMPTQTLDTRHHRQIHSLEQRRAQLEQRVTRYNTAMRDCNGHDPSLGRELDAASSRLAQVRAELRARLSADAAR